MGQIPPVKARAKARNGVVLLAVAAALAAGCGGGSRKDKIWVYRYPDFYRPDLKRVAVLPFANRTRVRNVGRRISDKVATLLTNNRTYEVYTRTHLADVLKEHDLAAAGIVDADVAKRIGRVKSVQALVCGVCNRCETVTKNETRHNRVPVWGTNAQGQRVITGWRNVPYRWARHDSYVECNVVVIDCATGRHVAAVSDPSRFWATGSPPKYAGADTLRLAEDDQVNRIVRALAVTRTQIKLKGDVLKTATGLYDNKWDWQRRFTPGDEKLYIVVKLPPEADRNNFKLTIVPKGEREVVAEKAWVWTKRHGSFGHAFKVKPIVEIRGLGQYQAKLYSGQDPIATYDFDIVAEG